MGFIIMELSFDSEKHETSDLVNRLSSQVSGDKILPHAWNGYTFYYECSILFI